MSEVGSGVELLEVVIMLRTATGTVTFTETQPEPPLGATLGARLRGRRRGGDMINRVAADARSWMRTQENGNGGGR